MTDYTELDSRISPLGLDYSATFVPFSMSRNAKPSPKISDLSVNWRVAIKRGAAVLETDYMQGIGHLPEVLRSQKGSYTAAEAYDIKYACEHGKYSPKRAHSDFIETRKTPLPAPELRDVLYSLVSDASVLDYSGFEDWAGDYGYDVDSRKVEKTYRACLDITLKLRTMIGDAGISSLREAFQDY